MLTAAHEAGVSPWVSLHHFTLPRWFADAGGFLIEAHRTDAWARHIDFVAETFGDLVAGWQPVNETNYYPLAAYRAGGWPPGHDDREEQALATEAVHLATAEAAVRLRKTGAPVSSIFGLSPVLRQDDDPATVTLAERIEAATGRPGSISSGKACSRSGDARSWSARPGRCLRPHRLLLLLGHRGEGWPPRRPPTRRPRLAPRLRHLGRRGRGRPRPVADRLPGTPLLVAEYGVGTDDDAVRAAYLERGLAVVHDAIGRGVDVRGFFHWTGVDNYESLHGYDVAFGILDRDRNVHPSARVLQQEALA